MCGVVNNRQGLCASAHMNMVFFLQIQKVNNQQEGKHAIGRNSVLSTVQIEIVLTIMSGI